jgi:hypothetical protein
MTDEIPTEEADDLLSRAYGVIRAYCAEDAFGAVALIGDDSDRLLPVLVGILMGVMEQIPGAREEMCRAAGDWLHRRRERLV